MLGSFQRSQIRIEIPGSEIQLYDSLTQPELMQQWLWPQRLSAGLPERLYPGLTFTTWLGPVAVEHRVTQVASHGLQLILRRGIDGVHEWYWGEGWIQSCLEGISLLPLDLGQSLTLLRLRQFLSTRPQSR